MASREEMIAELKTIRDGSKTQGVEQGQSREQMIQELKSLRDATAPKEYDWSNAPRDLARSTIDALPIYGQAIGSIAGNIGAGAGQAVGNSLKKGINDLIDKPLSDNFRLPTKEQVLDVGLDAAKNFGEGAALNMGGQILGKGIEAGASAVGKGAKSVAERLAIKATGATGKQSEKFAKNAGRELLDQGVVKFGDDAAAVAKRAGDKISQSEQTIDKSLKALDDAGVTVHVDKIVESLQSKINSLKSDPSQAPVAKKLQSMIDDIIETGNSNIKLSDAEITKRGYNKVARNWLDPEQGEAGKTAYLAYRDAVEEAAKKANPEIAEQFVQAKKTYGLMNPIQEAAEKRAATLNQSPFGGLLDVATVGAGSAGGLVAGLPGAIAGAAARRVVAPRIASSAAVSADGLSKLLGQSSVAKQVLQSTPEVAKRLVQATTTQAENRFAPMLKAADNEEPKKGYAKWENDGAEKLQQHDSALSKDQIEQLKKTKKGRDLLIRASDLKPKSKAMDNLVGQIKEIEDN